MRVKRSSENQLQQDPEWIRDFSNFLNKNRNKEKLEVVKKIFVETYFENIRNGMNTREALQNAKMTALCFLIQLL